jgi:hypothetical protein
MTPVGNHWHRHLERHCRSAQRRQPGLGTRRARPKLDVPTTKGRFPRHPGLVLIHLGPTRLAADIVTA